MCWPVGRPRICSALSSLKVKMRVSQEIVRFEVRMALRHDRGSRNTGFGDKDVGWVSSRVRRWRDEESKVPMWYAGIIAFAVSLSTTKLAGEKD